MGDEMKIAQIGTGYWGRNHARVWRELKDEGVVDDIILCDINEDAVKPLAEDLKLEYLTSPEEILENYDIDAVDIVAPTSRHYDLAKKFLMVGKDVFVEKPLTLTSKQSEELIQIAEDKKLILMPGHVFRYHPALQELKKKISRGELGEIRYLNTIRSGLRIPRNDMGVLLALGIHDVDIYSYLLDREYPDEVYCSVQYNIMPKIEDIAYLLLKYGNINGYIFESWLTPIGNKIRELHVIGESEAVRINYLKPDILEIYNSGVFVGEEKKYILQNEGMRTETVPYKEPLKEELKDFINSIQKRRQPISDMYHGMKAIKIIEYAIESSKNGKPITL